MEVILIRHGQTVNNKNKAFQGWSDLRLDEKGIMEAQNTGLLLSKEKIDAVFSSPLIRAVDTANIVASKTGNPPVYFAEGIKEINFGLFEGLTYDEIYERHKDEAKRWNDESLNYHFPKGESVREFFKRIIFFMDSLKEKDYKKVALVTHGGCIKSILSYVAGGSLDMFWKFMANTGSISRVIIEKDFSYILSVNENYNK